MQVFPTDPRFQVRCLASVGYIHLSAMQGTLPAGTLLAFELDWLT
jgi:hypothetical protein